MDILIGLGVLAVIALVFFLAKHHPTPTLPAARDVVTGVVAGMEGRLSQLEASFGDAVSKVPALVSAEVARLTADLAAATQHAAQVEAKAAADKAAHDAALATVAARVTAAITGSPELPPGAASPDVAAAQAEDAAAVRALATEISPAS